MKEFVMAEQILTERQMARLLEMSGEDFDAQLIAFSGKIASKEAEEIRAAVRSNDLGRVQMLVDGMQKSLDVSDFQKIQAAVQKNTFVHQVVEAARTFNIVEAKKKEGKTLQVQEEQFLAQKEQLSAGIKYAAGLYPTAMEESILPQNETEKVSAIVKENEGETASLNTGSPEDRVSETMGSEKIDSSESVSLNITHPIDREALREDYVDSTVPDKTPATDVNDINLSPEAKQPYRFGDENETATASWSDAPIVMNQELTPEKTETEDRLTEKPDTYRGFNDKDPYDSFTGDSDFEKEGIKANDDQAAVRRGETVEPSQLSDLYPPKGEYGFAGDWQFADPKKMEWLPLIEKTVLDPMKKFGNEKDLSDLVIDVACAAAMMPIEFAVEALKQRRDNKKESEKRLNNNRNNAIDSNLRSRGLTRNDLASRLAHETKNWILNDPNYASIADTGPYTKYEKAMKAKKDFAASLPRKENGDLDWSKMSSKQQKQYAQYMSAYSLSHKWQNYVCEMAGVQFKTKEFIEQSNIAAQMQVEDPLLAKAEQAKAQGNVSASTMQRMQNIEQKASSAPTLQAPMTIRSKEELEAQKDLENLKKLEPLSDVKISGTAKNPKMTLPDGTVIAVSNATKEQLEAEARRIERQAKDLKEQAEKSRQNMREISQVRFGRETRQQPIREHTNAGMGRR